MTVTSTTSSRRELESRRDAILRELGVSLGDLEDRRAAGHLTADEWSAWEELDGIGFLLGNA